MRRVFLLVLLLLIVGCHPKHAAGSFARSGFEDGELSVGDRAFSCGNEGRCTLDGTVCGVGKSIVRFCYDKSPSESYTRARERVLPTSHLRPGMLVQVNGKKDWVRAAYVDKRQLSVEGESMPVRWQDVVALTDTAPVYDHHIQSFDTTAGVFLILLTIGLLVLARRLQLRANALEREASFRAEDEQSQAPVATESPLEVLRCPGCGTPVKLVAELHAKCAGCEKQVDIPPAYVDLVKKRAFIAASLPAQAAALQRARIMANPMFALLLLAAGYGSYRGFGWLMAHESGGGDAAFWIITSFPLFYIPVGCIVAAYGQLSGRRVLTNAVPALAAIKVDAGYTCRGCGAALGATQDGVAEACIYCGVQNLIASQITASDAIAAKTARSLTQTIGAASAAFWFRFYRLFVWPLYFAGAIGLILYPFILVAGLSS